MDAKGAAPREINDRRGRAAAVARMRQMVAEGEIDLSVLGGAAPAPEGNEPRVRAENGTRTSGPPVSAPPRSMR